MRGIANDNTTTITTIFHRMLAFLQLIVRSNSRFILFETRDGTNRARIGLGSGEFYVGRTVPTHSGAFTFRDACLTQPFSNRDHMSSVNENLVYSPLRGTRARRQGLSDEKSKRARGFPRPRREGSDSIARTSLDS